MGSLNWLCGTCCLRERFEIQYGYVTGALHLETLLFVMVFYSALLT